MADVPAILSPLSTRNLQGVDPRPLLYELPIYPEPMTADLTHHRAYSLSQLESSRALLLDLLHRDHGRLSPDVLQGLDEAAWSQLGELAVQAKVVFPVYQRLQQPPLAGLVPASLLSRLNGLAKSQATHRLKLRATLSELLRACQDADLPVLVLKGAHLAETFYAEPLIREISDIDLLITPSDLPRATGLLGTLGYEIPHDVGDLRDLAPTDHEYTLIHPRWGIALDIHWSLTHANQARDVDETAIWARAQSLTLAGAPALGMAIEDLLLFLCFHASHQHHFSFVGLRPLLDIAVLCEARPAPDWQLIVHRALEWRWHRGVHLTLWLARDLLGAAVPRAVLGGLVANPGDLDRERAAALDAIFLESGPEQGIKSNIMRLWTATSLSARILILLERMLPPRAKLIQELGLDPHGAKPPLLWLRIRWLGRLFFLYGGKMWALARHDPTHVAELERRHRLVAWLDHDERG